MADQTEIRQLIEQRDAAYVRGDLREVERIDRRLQELVAAASRPSARSEKRIHEHEVKAR